MDIKELGTIIVGFGAVFGVYLKIKGYQERVIAEAIEKALQPLTLAIEKLRLVVEQIQKAQDAHHITLHDVEIKVERHDENFEEVFNRLKTLEKKQ